MAEQNPSPLFLQVTEALSESHLTVVGHETEVFWTPGDGMADELGMLGQNGEAERLRVAVAFRKPTYNMLELSQGLSWLMREAIGLESAHHLQPYRYSVFGLTPRLQIGYVVGRETLGTINVTASYAPEGEGGKATDSKKIEVARHVRLNLFPDEDLAEKYISAPAGINIPIHGRSERRQLAKTA